MVVHHHLIVIAKVNTAADSVNCDSLNNMLSELVKEIRMNKLFEPIVVYGKYGYTGIAGIVTSHIAFHYFENEKTLHLDVYSCKEYDLGIVMNFLDSFWNVDKADVVFIERDHGPKITEMAYVGKKLLKRNTPSHNNK